MSPIVRRLWKTGDPFVWLTAGALATAILMIGGLIFLICTQALGVFWPRAVAKIELADGRVVVGPIRDEEIIPDAEGGFGTRKRLLVQVGNRDLFGADFRWLDGEQVRNIGYPAELVTLEREEWGNFYGWLDALQVGGETVAQGSEATWHALVERLPAARKLAARILRLERKEMGDINQSIEEERLQLRRLEYRGAPPSAIAAVHRRLAELQQGYEQLHKELEELRAAVERERVVLRAADGKTKELPLAVIVRAYRANTPSLAGKVRIYLSKLWEFVSGDPRESNTEGGVFPAIFGTVLMVLIMSVAVVPFGVLAALYLREYARPGSWLRLVRIAVNNLAGVPSIVFGVFGLGFFVYFVGGTIDSLFYPERLPAPTFGTGGILWASLTLALLTVPVVIVATEEGLAAVPRELREGSYALGATKFETIKNVVLPAALPGILTGLILAMARGAGEVAPLMITGVVKLAPTLPLDTHWPFLHLERKFMHLGFHIYDVGFQSPNVEAAKPMVYATTLLLVGIVMMLNLTAILLRARVRRRLSGGVF
ncbi:MAG: phosphate ABC transporter permease PstA [Candidatus Binatia bacterium]|nr:phosphate ABC transporter permease PstA [Candidatus Binatia bacterium]